MKNKALFNLLIICTLSSLPACNNSSQKPERSTFIPDGYILTFHDEFETFKLDTAGDGSENWAPWWVGWKSRFLAGNNEKAWKCDSTYSGNGNEILGITLHELSPQNTLKLYGKVTPEKKVQMVNNKPYIGGMISSQMSHAQTYGYFESKVRFSLSKGHHWSIWMIPTNNDWPPEIDILEVVGHQPDLMFMNGHWRENGEHNSEMTTVKGVYMQDFNTYGFEWTSDSLYWYVNGQKQKQMPNFIHEAMYYIVSPEIGGNWPGMPDSTTVWPTICEIDYIRMYQKTE